MVARYTAVLGLGSNEGPSAEILQAAWVALQEVPGVIPWRLSSPYRSKPVGMESCHWFVNAVGVLRTTLAPVALLQTFHSIETQFGRWRDPAVSSYQDRPLDLDLLLYDDLVVTTPELVVPHPRMDQRRFVLEPLLEIASEIALSPFDKPMEKWAKACLFSTRDQPVERCCWEDFQGATTIQLDI